VGPLLFLGVALVDLDLDLVLVFVFVFGFVFGFVLGWLVDEMIRAVRCGWLVRMSALSTM